MFIRNHFRNQKVLVAGFGRFGACLAALSKAGYAVMVIDKLKSAFQHLSDSLQGFVIERSAANVHVLDSCQAGNLSCTACGSKAGKDIRSCVRRRKTT